MPMTSSARKPVLRVVQISGHAQAGIRKASRKIKANALKNATSSRKVRLKWYDIGRAHTHGRKYVVESLRPM